MFARPTLTSHRTPSHRARVGFVRARTLVITAAVAGLVALGVTPVASASAAAGAQTLFVHESFTGSSVSGYIKPTAPAGTNAACLTASSNTSATVPGCSSTAIDAVDSGALRLTSAGNTLEGGIGATQSVPISKGLDASFDSYQYGGTAADGIVFYLAVTDPYNPQVPTAIGQAGGSLGYSATAGSSPGLAHGYLGLGVDVYGNYLNSGFDGTGCSTAPANSTQPANVTVRGPGNGKAGYCVLPGYNSSLGGANALHGTTRANSKVPVEVVINPSASGAAFTDPAFAASSLTVAPRSYAIAFTTIGASTPLMVTGTLPDLRTAAYTGLVDPSWFDPNTGLPYKLTYGWVASTGGSTDVHEVNNLDVQTLNGPVPVLTSTSSVSTATPEHGATATYTVSPSVSSTGGAESSPVRVTTTFPAGITPAAYAGTDYTCALSAQTETCTYTGTTAAGSALPALNLPFTATGTASATSTSISSVTASTDATAVTSAASVTIAKIPTTTTLTVSPTPPTYGSSETFTATVSPVSTGTVVTGTVAFVDSTTGVTLCAAAVVAAGVATCTTTAAGPIGSHTVTATYSGDANHAASVGTLTASTQVITTAITASALPASVAFGSTSTLTASGLPSAAGGTVTFTDADGTPLCTAAAGARSCTTSATLAAGSYAVTAAYSGDTYYAAATSTNTASLEVTKATATITDTVNGAPSASTVYGTPATLATQGLAAGATGTIAYTTASGTALCTATLPDASCATSATLVAGSYDVTASYSGDANHAAAVTTAAAQLTVTPVAVGALLSTVNGASAATITHGETALFDSTGLPSGATGTLSYTTASGSVLCTATLPDATCVTSKNLGGGIYTVTAQYSGDANHQAATGPAVTLTVAPEASVITARVKALARTAGGATTITATGTPEGATGTLTFRSNGKILCTATLPETSCTTTDLGPGEHSVEVTYSGDPSYAPSQTTITVAVPDSVKPAALASTGSSVAIAGTIGTAGALIALGVLMLLVARRRRGGRHAG